MGISDISNSELHSLLMLCEHQIAVRFAKCSIDGRQTREYNDLIASRMVIQNEAERRIFGLVRNEPPAKADSAAPKVRTPVREKQESENKTETIRNSPASEEAGKKEKNENRAASAKKRKSGK